MYTNRNMGASLCYLPEKNLKLFQQTTTLGKGSLKFTLKMKQISKMKLNLQAAIHAYCSKPKPLLANYVAMCS